MESSDTFKCSIELLYFFGANTTVLGEKIERLRVIIKSLEVNEVLVNGIKGLLFGGSGEKNASISSLNGVLNNWRLVIWSTVYLFDASDAKSTK